MAKSRKYYREFEMRSAEIKTLTKIWHGNSSPWASALVGIPRPPCLPPIKACTIIDLL